MKPQKAKTTIKQEEEEVEEEEVQDVEPKKQNTCNRQIRSTDSDGNDSVSNERPNTIEEEEREERTKKPCHRRTNQNL